MWLAAKPFILNGLDLAGHECRLPCRLTSLELPDPYKTQDSFLWNKTITAGKVWTVQNHLKWSVREQFKFRMSFFNYSTPASFFDAIIGVGLLKTVANSTDCLVTPCTFSPQNILRSDLVCKLVLPQLNMLTLFKNYYDYYYYLKAVFKQKPSGSTYFPQLVTTYGWNK